MTKPKHTLTRFNSTLVQLKSKPCPHTQNLESRFNSTLVQLKKYQFAEWGFPILVSIPHWFN